MSERFDYLVFIGRFEPFHLGHAFVVREALARCERLIMLIGSAHSPRTTKNPFGFAERQAMILESFFAERERIICLPIIDTLYDDQLWLQNVQRAVDKAISDHTYAQPSIAVIGHTKDDSSYYLSLFPNWRQIELPNFEGLSATPLRQAYFTDGIDARLADGMPLVDRLPKPTQAFLTAFMATPDYEMLCQEYTHLKAYKEAWRAAPYAPIFVTADALVVCAGHILIIERGGEYGRGLWALAGGFLDQGESLLACAIRETYEETGLRLDTRTPKASKSFDAPGRSSRGRTLTTVFYFELEAKDGLPKLQAGDDASRAFWLPFGSLDGERMFEDHYSIIVNMLGID